MSCPTTETLERLALGFLDDEAPVREHAKACAACASRLQVLAGEHAALTAAAKDVRLPRIAEPKRRPLAARLWRPVAIAAVGLITILLALMVAPMGAPPAPGSAEKEIAGYYDERVAKSRLKGESSPAVAHEGREEVARLIRNAETSGHRLVEDAYAGRRRVPPDPKAEPAPAYTPAPPSPVVPEPVIAKRPELKPEPPKEPPKPAEPPVGNIFAAPGVNPTILVAKESTSTFALDVDTASYTIVRRFLKDGILPPPDAVRVEEFLNYFRYADPRPPKGAFQVRLEAAPSPFDPERHLLRIAVQAREISDKDRKDVVLTFVIDVSGSMSMENRLGLVKRSLHCLVDKLRPTDKVGIVVYGSTGRKLLDPTLAVHRAQILGVIDELRTEGSTNLEAGLNIGYQLAADHFSAAATNRVIVCTDGVANNGATDPVVLLDQVAEKAKKGVWLSVLGFGMGNMHDALMEKLADKGNGNYAYIDEFKEAKKIFSEKLVGMMEVVAADAKVQVEFDPATVVEYRQIGYENRRLANEDFRNDKVDAGEVGANHHVTALYEVKLKPGGMGRLATVRLRYREPDTKEVVESQDSLGRAQVLDEVDNASASYRLAAAVAEFAEALRGTKGIALKEILKQASRAAADLDRPEDAVEFVDLVKRAAELRK